MSRFGNTTYNATGSTNTQDYKDREPMLMGRYVILEATLEKVGVYSGNFGKSLILNMDDVEVLEGVITSRTDNGDGEADEKTKLFGWDKWYDRDENMELVPFEEGGEISTDDLGRRVTEEAGGDTYKYEIEGAVLEGRDEPVDIDDRELWLGNGKKSRTLAKVFSQRGHDIIDQDNKRDDREWLNAEDDGDFALRPELEGRRIMFWFEQTTLSADEVDDLDQDVTFTDAVVLDAETETPITIVNDDEEGDADGDADSTDTDDESGAESGVTDLPADVEELVDMFARTGQDDRDSIENIVSEEAPSDYEVDMDLIMSEIEARS